MYALLRKPAAGFFVRLALSALLFFSALGLIVPPSIWAAGGDGSGGGTGSGGNEDEPLLLIDSSITSGQVDVPTDVVIQLDFNKNICSLEVIDENKDCFHLWSEDGAETVVIPIVVMMPDDQIQRDYKEVAFISPQQPLEANATYTLAIDNTLTAKNGSKIYNAYTIKFTTGDLATGETSPILDKLGEGKIRQYQTARAPTQASIPEDKPPYTPKDNSDKGGGIGVIQVIVVVAVATFVIGGAGVLFIRSRRKQNLD